MFYLSAVQKRELITSVVRFLDGSHAFRGGSLWVKIGEHKWQDTSEWSIDTLEEKLGCPLSDLSPELTPLGGIGRICDYRQIYALLLNCNNRHDSSAISSLLESHGFVTSDIRGMNTVIQSALERKITDLNAFVKLLEPSNNSIIFNPNNHPRAKYFVDPTLFQMVNGFSCSQDPLFINVLIKSVIHEASRNHPSIDDLELNLLSLFGGQNLSIQTNLNHPLPLSVDELPIDAKKIIEAAMDYYRKNEAQRGERELNKIVFVRRPFKMPSREERLSKIQQAREHIHSSLQRSGQERPLNDTELFDLKSIEAKSFRSLELCRAPLAIARDIIDLGIFTQNEQDRFHKFWNEQIQPLWNGPIEELKNTRDQIMDERIVPFFQDRSEHKLNALFEIWQHEKMTEHPLTNEIILILEDIRRLDISSRKTVSWWTHLYSIENISNDDSFMDIKNDVVLARQYLSSNSALLWINDILSSRYSVAESYYHI